ncbi:acyltransferase family protein [Mangrovimonas sp. YM274]|uniref:acyltransferase family protein n=1 Tax=Mangrovimonas sp. YM274 TaxID=3070660 RepID=UPI0027DB9C56|nr:acyltransferase family protein [Mangrovimonas sp. YM274]WMI68443.1 acyltransferase family protein [Mangrovimonas sp. YM274]
MSKLRNDTFDKISGVLILWMIIYHAFGWGELKASIIYNVLLKLLFFFIPWFYFKRGMFIKTNQKFSKTLQKEVENLLVPMVVWMSVGYIIVRLPELFNGNYSILKILLSPIFHLIKSGETVGNSSLWFLLSLFIAKMVMFLVLKLSIKNIAILSVGLLVLGAVFKNFNLVLPLGIHNLPLAIFFVCAGYLYNRLELMRKLNKRSLVILSITFLALFFFYPSYVDFHVNQVFFGNYCLYVINSLIGIILSINIFRYIKSNSLAWIGEKSKVFLVLHWPVFQLIKLLKVSNNYLYVFVLISVVAILSVLAAKFIPEKYLGLNNKKITNSIFFIKIIRD